MPETYPFPKLTPQQLYDDVQIIFRRNALRDTDRRARFINAESFPWRCPDHPDPELRSDCFSTAWTPRGERVTIPIYREKKP